MYSAGELRFVRAVGTGRDTVGKVASELGMTGNGAYRIARSLREKGVVSVSRGRVSLERRAHVGKLTEVLTGDAGLVDLLSGCGIPVLMGFLAPSTVTDVARGLELNRVTVSRKASEASGRGILVRTDGGLTVNRRAWADLAVFLEEQQRYDSVTVDGIDHPVTVYRRGRDFVVYSSPTDEGDPRTGFSVYGDHGVELVARRTYYCRTDRELTMADAFVHSLYIIEIEEDWNDRLLAVIFYLKHRDVLRRFDHPLIRRMESVIAGRSPKGWPLRSEVRDVMEAYGVEMPGEDRAWTFPSIGRLRGHRIHIAAEMRDPLSETT